MAVDLTVVVPAFSRLVAAAITDDVDERDFAQVEQLLADAARVQGLAESVRLAAASRLRMLSDQGAAVDPETTLGNAGRTSQRDASQTARRARAVDAIPQLAASLADGEVSAAHIDSVANTLGRLDPDQRDLLAAEGEWIAIVAAHSTPEELTRTLTKRARQLTSDDGVARFERQRRATTLRHWIDQISGMVCIHGEFDPEIGARLVAALQHQMERLFHDAVPDTCPTDDRKQGHLRALALAHLATRGATDTRDATDPACPSHRTTGTTGTTGTSPDASPPTRAGPNLTRPDWTQPARDTAPEFIVVIDLRTLCDGPHEHSRVEITGGVELPIETLRRHACLAEIIPVIIDGNGVAINVGRAHRLATRAQRRALRAMYATCAVPGCTLAFDQCQPHHLWYWEHGGPTDIDNLIPLCSKHHHAVHEGGWRLSLAPGDRVLTITLPNGNTYANPPPSFAL